MTEMTLHPEPRWRDVLVEQIRFAGLSLRPVALVVAAVLAAATVMIVGEVLTGGPGFDSNETFPTALIAFLFPFAVWRGEPPFGAAFLWTLPVDRRRLALTRVLAGGFWLLVALAGFLCWLLTLTMIAGTGQILARVPIIETLAMYMLGSALVLGLRYPLRWLLGAAGLLLLFGSIGDILAQPDDGEWDRVPGARAWFSFAGRGFALWATLPDPAQWAISTLLWSGAGIAALLIAVSRHREHRRP